jgi:hypothetical protein
MALSGMDRNALSGLLHHSRVTIILRMSYLYLLLTTFGRLTFGQVLRTEGGHTTSGDDNINDR